MNKTACTKDSLAKQKQLFGFTVSQQLRIYGSSINIAPSKTKTNRHHLLLNIINDNPHLIYGRVLPNDTEIKNSDLVSFYEKYKKISFGGSNEKLTLTKTNFMICLGHQASSVSNIFAPNKQGITVITIQSSIFIALQFQIQECGKKQEAIKEVIRYFYEMGYAKAT